MNTAIASDQREYGHGFSARLRQDSFTPFECACAVLGILAVAAIGTASQMSESTGTLIYTLIVVVFAIHSGFFQASILAFVALLCRTYFFATPAFDFDLLTSDNASTIFLFETTALIVSQLAAREKLHAGESERQRVKAERLYSLSRRAIQLDMSLPAPQQLAELIHAEFSLEAVAICDRNMLPIGAAGAWGEELDRLGSADSEHTSPDDKPTSGTIHGDLMTADASFGRLIIRGRGLTQFGIESLASLVALTLERHNSFEREGQAEAARRTEQLRTTVLDGLAHAFKTPLTVIRAGSSGLLELGGLSTVQEELVVLIDEQSARLDDLATRLLQTARLEDEEVSLQWQQIDVASLIREVVAEFQREQARTGSGAASLAQIKIAGPSSGLCIWADDEMLRSTLYELLENAVKYSRNGSPISLSASGDEHEVLLKVHSWSGVIRMEDRERIFERYYRSEDHRESTRGTGIGLSVAKQTAEAHRGSIWVTSSEQEGTTFHISLPIQAITLEQEVRTATWQFGY